MVEEECVECTGNCSQCMVHLGKNGWKFGYGLPYGGHEQEPLRPHSESCNGECEFCQILSCKFHPKNKDVVSK